MNFLVSISLILIALLPGQGKVPLVTATVAVNQGESIIMILTIREGYHIQAHEPGNELFIPLEISFSDSSIVKNIRYPEGEPFYIEDLKSMVYKGEITVRILLSRPLRTADSLKATLSYQPCTDKKCLFPQRVDVVIE